MHTHIVRIHFDRNNHSFIHSEFFCSILNDNFITGDADDSLSTHNETKFSTNDEDNDKWSSGSCANDYKGGWWFYDCHQSNLNGFYNGSSNGKREYAQGIFWKYWKAIVDVYYSLKKSEMKVRPPGNT